MLDEAFLADLRQAFPDFYAKVNEEAMHEASRLRAQAGGDVDRALQRARLEGAMRVWWPYVRGTIPLVGDERPAMEAFSRIVLTVDHVVGYQPPGMEAARDQVAEVLAQTFDAERVVKLLGADGRPDEAAAAGATGLVASASALMVPFTTLKRARKAIRFVPAPLRVAVGVAIVATLASIPLAAGYSAGSHAARAARSFGEVGRIP